MSLSGGLPSASRCGELGHGVFRGYFQRERRVTVQTPTLFPAPALSGAEQASAGHFMESCGMKPICSA